jgi:hypothetical protein
VSGTTDSSTAEEEDTNKLAWHVGILLTSDAATWLRKY